MLYGVIRRLHDADDVLQLVRIRILQSLDTLTLGEDRHDERFCAWSLAVARHIITDLARREDSMMTSVENAIFEQLKAEGLSPSRAAAEIEAKEALSICIGRLPPLQRALLSMKYDKKLTDREIASRLGDEEPAVRGRRQRLLSELAECLGRSSKYEF